MNNYPEYPCYKAMGTHDGKAIKLFTGDWPIRYRLQYPLDESALKPHIQPSLAVGCTAYALTLRRFTGVADCRMCFMYYEVVAPHTQAPADLGLLDIVAAVGQFIRLPNPDEDRKKASVLEKEVHRWFDNMRVISPTDMLADAYFMLSAMRRYMQSNLSVWLPDLLWEGK